MVVYIINNSHSFGKGEMVVEMKDLWEAITIAATGHIQQTTRTVKNGIYEGCEHYKVLNLHHIVDGKPYKSCDIGEHPESCRSIK